MFISLTLCKAIGNAVLKHVFQATVHHILCLVELVINTETVVKRVHGVCITMPVQLLFNYNVLKWNTLHIMNKKSINQSTPKTFNSDQPVKLYT